MGGSVRGSSYVQLLLLGASDASNAGPFYSQSKSDALTRMSRYLTFCGWLLRWSWYWLAMARGGAKPMRPIMSNGETTRVSDLDLVSPTVMRPRQSSVSSVGEPSG